MYMSWKQGKFGSSGQCGVSKTLIIKSVPQKLSSLTQKQLYVTEVRPIVDLDLLLWEGAVGEGGKKLDKT